MEGWDAAARGVLTLPSGRRIRGRALRDGLPGGAQPQLGVYLLGRRPTPVVWDSHWVVWRDFGLPSIPDDFHEALREAWRRSATERVEIACQGGRGRTGTMLACLAVVDGVPAREAVDFVRAGYDRRAVEVPWQRRFVERLTPA